MLTIKQNQIKMIKARGYDTSHEDWILTVKPDKFEKKLIKKHGQYPIRKLLFGEYTKPNCRPLFVYYIGLQEGKQIKADPIQVFVTKMTEEKKDGLLIINSNLSSKASTYLKYVTEYQYQIFKEEELNCNLLSHDYVADYQLVEFNIKPSYLHTLTLDDPVVRYFNYPKGSIIKVKEDIHLDVLLDEIYYYCVVG